MASIAVLHVDDDPDIRAITETSLGLDPAWAICSCASGKDALSITAEWPPDLILLDVMMPDMDGPATLALLQKQSRTAGVPVVFVTAIAQPEEHARLLSIGAAGVITKPFDPATLPARLHVLVYQLHQKIHAKLEQSVEKRTLLTAIVESSDDAIIAKTLEGRIISWNGGAERLFGYTAAEVVGQHISLLIPEHLRKDENYIVSQLQKGNAVGHFETVRTHKSGRSIDISLSVSAIRDQTGRIIGASKVARGIGERKSIEAALRTSEQRNELALSGMSVGLWDWDVVTNALYRSPRYMEILGAHEGDFVPDYDEFVSCLHPEDRQRTLAALQAHLDKEGPYDIEHRLRRQDGEYVWIHAVGQAAWDESGKPLRMVGSIDDITSRKQGEDRFRLVVESAPNAMAMVDRQGAIVLVNRQTEKLFGYSRDELLGLPIERLMPERYRHRHPGHRNGVFATPAPMVPDERRMAAGRELHGLRKDGSEFSVEIGLTPIQTDAGMMVLSAIVDVTERKQAEQQNLKFNEMLEQQVARRTAQLVAANKELDDFAHVASHDLKAPLRVIDNASKWLEQDLAAHLDDETRDTMRLLRGRVKRMEKLLDDLLQYSRVGRTSEAASDGMVAGNDLVDDILTLLSPPEAFKVTVGPGFAAIRMERMPLQQILMNLISNAIKHHDRKEGRIELEVEDRGGLFAFAVKDDGPGIPAQFHDEIFKIFRTLKPRDQVEGSGMGLAIVRKHIDISGGSLWLESAEGKGSTFHFTWPKPQAKLESRVGKCMP